MATPNVTRDVVIPFVSQSASIIPIPSPNLNSQRFSRFATALGSWLSRLKKPKRRFAFVWTVARRSRPASTLLPSGNLSAGMSPGAMSPNGLAIDCTAKTAAKPTARTSFETRSQQEQSHSRSFRNFDSATVVPPPLRWPLPKDSRSPGHNQG